jgi:hypothetical protein
MVEMMVRDRGTSPTIRSEDASLNVIWEQQTLLSTTTRISTA